MGILFRRPVECSELPRADISLHHHDRNLHLLSKKLVIRALSAAVVREPRDIFMTKASQPLGSV